MVKFLWPGIHDLDKFLGLGIHDLDKFSRALQLRWLWLSWHAPNRPWIGTKLPCKDQDRNTFAAATSVNTGNGGLASLWDSSWIGAALLRALAPSLLSKTRRKSKSVKDGLMNSFWIRDISRLKLPCNLLSSSKHSSESSKFMGQAELPLFLILSSLNLSLPNEHPS